MANLEECRARIDEINKEIIEKVDERMRISEEIAKYKQENDMRIVDPLREHALMDKVTEDSAEDMAYYNRMLFSLLMEMSADHQRQVTNSEAQVVKDIRKAIQNTPQVFPESAIVACQGVQGAYSQEACEKFFKMPKIIYTKNFKGVFAAIDQGLCRYGVLPIENSTAGSVNQVYDLMKSYDFHIVKSMRVKIEHCLLVNHGVQKADIKEVISHEQALSQCEDYLRREFPDAKITVYENTATSAKYLAESGRKDAAVLGSEICGSYYSLDCLESSVQDNDNNYTRFICITKPLEIYPGANKTSFMCVTDHTPGSLYKVLSAINACGINLTKLESRPIPGSDFDFSFYFDFEESVYTEQFVRLINHLDGVCKEFRYMGSYIEV
jgi:chorismate mutase / prephenate dehydratase